MSRRWIWPPAGIRDYRGFEVLTRAGLAAHWLRRDSEYGKLAPAAIRRTPRGLLIDAAPRWCVERWGCLHIVQRSEHDGPPFLWSAAVQPAVLRVTACSAGEGDPAPFDLSRWVDHAALVVGHGGCQHLALYGRSRMLRLDVVSGSLLSGPVQLHYPLSCGSASDMMIETLKRLQLLCRTGDFGSLPIDRPPSRRAIEALRVHDALAEGASIRDIGVMLFGAARIGQEWHAPGEALKSCCRRLIAHARCMASGGYRSLLR
jgi:hypothetical protein